MSVCVCISGRWHKERKKLDTILFGKWNKTRETEPKEEYPHWTTSGEALKASSYIYQVWFRHSSGHQIHTHTVQHHHHSGVSRFKRDARRRETTKELQPDNRKKNWYRVVEVCVETLDAMPVSLTESAMRADAAAAFDFFLKIWIRSLIVYSDSSSWNSIGRFRRRRGDNIVIQNARPISIASLCRPPKESKNASSWKPY